MDRGAWQATVHGVARARHDLVTEPAPCQLYPNKTGRKKMNALYPLSTRLFDSISIQILRLNQNLPQVNLITRP